MRAVAEDKDRSKGKATLLLRIYLLGQFQVHRGDELIAEEMWKSRKAKALFKILALRPNHQIPKDQVLELLWPDLEPQAANNNLYRTVHFLRRILEPDLTQGTSSHYVVLQGEVIALRPEHIGWLDVEQFLKRADEARRLKVDLSKYEEALGLYLDDLLPEDIYEDWPAEYRERLQGVYLSLILELSKLYRQEGSLGKAIDSIKRLLTKDNCHEEAHRELMRLYALSGHRHQALRQYHTCKEALRRELEADPSPETDVLYQQILAGQPIGTDEVAGRSPSREVTHSQVARVGPPQGRLSLVGRDKELEELEGYLARAMAGEQVTVLLSGDSGIGKTSLCREMLARARNNGAQVLAGSCNELEGCPPYGPFVEALSNYLNTQSPPIVHRLIEGVKDDLSKLLPGLRDTDRGTRVSSSSLTIDPLQEQLRLFGSVTELLANASAIAPVVLFLDDLHYADETSLQLFHYVVRNTSSLPSLILATFREEELRTNQPLERLVAEMYKKRLCQRLTLRPLPPQDLSRMATLILGEGEVDTALLQAIYKITEGNPFFTQELLRSLNEEGKVARLEGRWALLVNEDIRIPRELRHLVRLRFERLGDESKKLLALASVIGREFSYSLVQSVSNLSDGQLLDLMELALGARIAEETEDGYRFVHAIIREVLYSDISQQRRAKLHGGVAAVLEELYRDRIKEQVEALAYHYYYSDQKAKGIRYLDWAGDKAADIFAYHEAINHYRKALSLLEKGLSPDGDSPQHSRFRYIVSLLEKLGDVYRRLGDADGSLRYYEEALDGEGHQGSLDAAVTVRLNRKAAYSSVLNSQLERAARHLNDALAVVQPDSEELELARVHYVRAQMYWHSEELDKALEAAKGSLRIAEQWKAKQEVAQAYEIIALVYHSLGDWQQGIEYELKRQAIAAPEMQAAEALDAHL